MADPAALGAHEHEGIESAQLSAGPSESQPRRIHSPAVRLTDLAAELLDAVLSCPVVELHDVTYAARSCRALRAAVERSEALWRRLYEEMYGSGSGAGGSGGDARAGVGRLGGSGRVGGGGVRAAGGGIGGDRDGPLRCERIGGAAAPGGATDLGGVAAPGGGGAGRDLAANLEGLDQGPGGQGPGGPRGASPGPAQVRALVNRPRVERRDPLRTSPAMLGLARQVSMAGEGRAAIYGETRRCTGGSGGDSGGDSLGLSGGGRGADTGGSGGISRAGATTRQLDDSLPQPAAQAATEAAAAAASRSLRRDGAAQRAAEAPAGGERLAGGDGALPVARAGGGGGGHSGGSGGQGAGKRSGAGSAPNGESWRERFKARYVREAAERRHRRRIALYRLQAAVQEARAERDSTRRQMAQEAARLQQLQAQLSEVERVRLAGAAGTYWVPSAVQQHFSRIVTHGSAVDAATRAHALRQEVLLAQQSLAGLRRALPAKLRRVETTERDLRAMQGEA